ncbi:DUF4395 domain-containing protein [Schumannella soli]|uniref:DUF4395 domain-containing protein n=1 Tax=Schumannella soli TaxID=2590779 RepID=A0A506YB30_9MICO|nr:DUF4395 domain-containing protein [Schumannella soli]TPW77679.1 DUF4395 domain-containing protein [Schumannella soli]
MTSTPNPPGPAGGIDPRGPRFGAAITAVLLLVVIALALSGAALAATLLLTAIALVFAWGAFAGIRRHPYGRLYAALVRPRLAPPTELEDPRPPTFAQGIGFAITAVGAVLGLIALASGAPALGGLGLVVPIAAALAFVAAFLNSVFGVCLGCLLYLQLARLRRPAAPAA